MADDDKELPHKQLSEKQLPENDPEAVLSVVAPSPSSLSVVHQVQFDIYRAISQLDQQHRPILQIPNPDVPQQPQTLETEPIKLTTAADAVTEPIKLTTVAEAVTGPVVVPLESSHSRTTGRGATNINHLPNRVSVSVIYSIGR